METWVERPTTQFVSSLVQILPIIRTPKKNKKIKNTVAILFFYDAALKCRKWTSR